MFQQKDGVENEHLLANQLNQLFAKINAIVSQVTDSAISDDGKFRLDILMVNIFNTIRPAIMLTLDTLNDTGNLDILQAHENLDRFFNEEIHNIHNNSQVQIDLDEFLLKAGQVVIAWMRSDQLQFTKDIVSAGIVNITPLAGQHYPKNINTYIDDIYNIILNKLEEFCKCEHGSRQQFLHDMDIKKEFAELFEVYPYDPTTNNTSKQRIENICSSLISLFIFKTEKALSEFKISLAKWISSRPIHFDDDDISKRKIPSMRYENIGQVIPIIEYVLDSISRIDMYWCEDARKFWLFWESQLMDLMAKLVKMDPNTPSICIIEELVFWGNCLSDMDLKFLGDDSLTRFITSTTTATTADNSADNGDDNGADNAASSTYTTETDTNTHTLPPSDIYHPLFLSFSHTMLVYLDTVKKMDMHTGHNIMIIEKPFAEWLHDVIYKVQSHELELYYGKMKNVRYAQVLHSQFLAKHGEEIKIFYLRHYPDTNTTNTTNTTTATTTTTAATTTTATTTTTTTTTSDDDDDADTIIITADDDDVNVDNTLIDWENFIEDFVTYVLGMIDCLDESRVIRESYNYDIWMFLKSQLSAIRDRAKHGNRFEYVTNRMLRCMSDYCNYVNSRIIICQGCERGDQVPKRKRIRIE